MRTERYLFVSTRREYLHAVGAYAQRGDEYLPPYYRVCIYRNWKHYRYTQYKGR
jgi:hypothetical protein